MELAYVWQWPCISVQWSKPMFGNGQVYLYDGIGLYLAMTLYIGLCLAMTLCICAMVLAYVWQ